VEDKEKKKEKEGVNCGERFHLSSARGNELLSNDGDIMTMMIIIMAT